MKASKKSVKTKSNNKKQRKMPSFLKEFLEFYKENLRKKHIIVYVISLVIFFIFLAMFISSVDVTTSIEKLAVANTNTSNVSDIFNTILKQTIPSIFLVIFAGITPFIYLSVIGFAYPYVLAGDIAAIFLVNTHSYNVILMSLGAIIQIFAISLAMVAGFYYCSLSSRKFRYSQRSGFGMYDLKKSLYSIRKQEEKIKELDKKKIKKDEEIEKLNVKVPYKNLLQTFAIALVIAIIGTLIAAI